MMDYTIKIGGEAGQGIQTIGETLSSIFAKAGYHVFTHQDYESRIRGGHNFYQIRISDNPVTASRSVVNILVALDKESITLYENELSSDGQVLYDSNMLKQTSDRPNFLNVPLLDLAQSNGGSKIMANIVAVGAVLGMLGMQPDIMYKTIQEAFKKKGDSVVEANIKSARAGYEYAKEKCLQCSFMISSYNKPKMLISGNEAIGVGAIASGLKFYSAYPMTPSTGIMNYVADKAKDSGVIVEQAEDEIAAINMAIGASFAGVRAMTGTSGGGFALMVEGISLAGMTETPLVIALAQRPGPATGLPTRTEQADLLFALYAGHGEFPRVIFAPGTPEQAFYLTNKAFDLAEKYQITAIILTDQYLADSQWSFEEFDLKRLKLVDYRIREEQSGTIDEYKRHAFTESGISPFAVPGESKHLVVTDSDEHDEEGHIIEDALTRIKMVEKRLFKKMPIIRKEIEPPFLYGNTNPNIILVCWGSMFGVVKEVIDELADQYKIAMLHFSEIYPLPEEGNWLNLLSTVELKINIEQNATSQFASLLRAETGLKMDKYINRFDGRPFTIEELKERVYANVRGL